MLWLKTCELLMTEKWYYMNSLKKCKDSWTVSTLYLKSQSMGYNAVKQDNKYNQQKNPIMFQVHDAFATQHGLRQSVVINDDSLYNMPSSKRAYKSFNICEVPGVCDGGAGRIEYWFIYIYEFVMVS